MVMVAIISFEKNLNCQKKKYYLFHLNYNPLGWQHVLMLQFSISINKMVTRSVIIRFKWPIFIFRKRIGVVQRKVKNMKNKRLL